MKFLQMLMVGVLFTVSFAALSAAEPAPDTTVGEAYADIIRSLPALEPITYPSAVEKYRLLVFIDDQCVYCSYVVKNVKKYTDAGLTMSFLTVTPGAIRDSVIADMARVWCSSDRKKSLQNAMAGFLPSNDSTAECTRLIENQSALADRLGVNATPAMVVINPSAHTFLGSVPPDKILSDLQ